VAMLTGCGNRRSFLSMDQALQAALSASLGVRPIDSLPVDGPPSSAHSGRNRGGRTIGPALRAGRAFARIPENQLAATPPFPHFNAWRLVTHRSLPESWRTTQGGTSKGGGRRGMPHATSTTTLALAWPCSR
jgi:hypothetical protein